MHEKWAIEVNIKEFKCVSAWLKSMLIISMLLRGSSAHTLTISKLVTNGRLIGIVSL